MKPTSLFAVLFGTGVGVAAAIGGRAAADGEPPRLAPAAARPIDTRPAEPVSSIQHGPPPPPASVSAPPSHDPLESDPPIRSKEEFQAAAIACDEKDAGACRRAALASELGEVVPKDLARGKTFRRVELTALVRSCEKGGVDACLVLADRYLRGDGLAQSDTTATALIHHARTLCAKRLEPACGRLPAN